MHIVETTDEYGVIAEQYCGGSYDGAYRHQSVPELLDAHFGYTGNERKPSEWDPMHKAGIVDLHIRKDKTFRWLNDLTDITGQAFKHINWGKEFEHFLDVADSLKADKSFIEDVFSALPCFYSETKFANHCVRVYTQLKLDYPVLDIKSDYHSKREFKSFQR